MWGDRTHDLTSSSQQVGSNLFSPVSAVNEMGIQGSNSLANNFYTTVGFCVYMCMCTHVRVCACMHVCICEQICRGQR